MSSIATARYTFTCICPRTQRTGTKCTVESFEIERRNKFHAAQVFVFRVEAGKAFQRSTIRLIATAYGLVDRPKGPVTPPPRNEKEKRENCRPIKNQQLADFISRNEKT